jgi:hypothetical protein
MRTRRPVHALCIAVAAGITAASGVSAQDMASLATGGYARGLRTEAEMHKIDTDGDGTVSRDEWLAYQTKVFDALDKGHEGAIDEKEFLAPSSAMASFATGGYARGLQTREMMHKIDANGDGKVTRDEWLTYQGKVFDMMDTGKKGVLGPREFLARGSSSAER